MTYEIKYRVILARLASVAYPTSRYVPIHIICKNIKNKQKSEIETIEPLTQKIMAIFWLNSKLWNVWIIPDNLWTLKLINIICHIALIIHTKQGCARKFWSAWVVCCLSPRWLGWSDFLVDPTVSWLLHTDCVWGSRSLVSWWLWSVEMIAGPHAECRNCQF